MIEGRPLPVMAHGEAILGFRWCRTDARRPQNDAPNGARAASEDGGVLGPVNHHHQPGSFLGRVLRLSLALLVVVLVLLLDDVVVRGWIMEAGSVVSERRHTSLGSSDWPRSSMSLSAFGSWRMGSSSGSRQLPLGPQDQENSPQSQALIPRLFSGSSAVAFPPTRRQAKTSTESSSHQRFWLLECSN
ncbi:uncharacterized protein F5Z01DRAFT_259713 [Emericellopsis atlantica]|uniref:Uncharacterized protein n=1 Tax=Emericellopsis atlantica TaxID=2614577 RepID=A0A9P7ZH44_9HYPO|nr:uncharacterized protein F5Z01DRAFT_259713 [Emericellopsis atlantica]KAG9251979.1 hypothetical protein F5Z01DRAFT_259713 [Emericellopsis atlantica]